MKYKLKNKKKQNIILICLLFLLFSFVIIASYELEQKKVFLTDYSSNQVSKEIKRSSKINEFLKNIANYESYDFAKKITSLMYKEDNINKALIFDYITGEILDLEQVIKKDKLEEFNNKIKDLLYLKYPKFIASALENNANKEYFFKENELIIYYNNYVIDPIINEELYLKVNFNEISEYLDFTVNLDEFYENENGFKIDELKKHIAITFDDGPSLYTDELVDVLLDNKALSTFFFVGNKLNNYKNTVLKVYNTKNEIGYHSYAHQNLIRQSKDKIIEDYNKSNDILYKITNSYFVSIRPPYGSYNKNVLDSLPLPFIMWRIDTNDWRYKDVDYLVNHVLENVQDGDIILFHDSYRTSIDAVIKLLPILYSRGFQLVTVSQLAQIKGKTLNNHQVYRSLN
ncbi:MAG: hypothetical protein E7172_05660 [Firmicutes bacterium]|nr:hypothetical protein [Bacillota bacterium]